MQGRERKLEDGIEEALRLRGIREESQAKRVKKKESEEKRVKKKK